MKKIIALAATLALPVVSFAQYIPGGGANIKQTTGLVQDLLGYAIPILITVAVVYFLVSVIRYIMADANDKKERQGQMIRGIIGLFVAVAIWGILAYISSTLNVGLGGNIGQDYMISIEQPNIQQ